jgi:cytochrome c-type biogenesis protein CcmF
VLTLGLHLTLGARFGYPAIVPPAEVEPGLGGAIFARIASFFPALVVALSAMNISVVVQEFYRGTKARMSSTEKKGEPETPFIALLRLVQKSRRRYGGYIVHLGIVGMFLGFVGTAWTIDEEVSLNPGQSHQIADYTLTYEGTRMCPGNPKCSAEEQATQGRRMLFADFSIKQDGKYIGHRSPAKFIYQSPPQTTTEIGLMRGLRDDLYLVLATADPETKRATFTFHVNPFVAWIWIGLLILISGCSISLFPEMSAKRVTAWTYVRSGLTATAGIMMTVLFAVSLSQPYVRSFSIVEVSQSRAPWGPPARSVEPVPAPDPLSHEGGAAQ